MTSPMPNGPPTTDAERLRARQTMVANLTAALEALVRKLSAQRDVAVGACSLAPQAEEIARQARLLAFGRGRVPPEAVRGLVEAIGAMATEAAEVAAEIERGAAIGSQVIATIGNQLARVVAIARDPVRLADPTALRSVLGALAGTLQAMPETGQSQDTATQGVLELGRRAAALAERAQRLAAAGGKLQEEVLALSRDLGAYAAEAARVASALSTDAAQAEKALATMAGEVRNIAMPKAAAKGPEVDQRIATILQKGRDGSALDWGWERNATASSSTS